MSNEELSGSREDILSRIRERLGRTPGNGAAGRAAIDACLAQRPQGPRPAVEGDLAARFRMRSEALASTVDEVAGWGEVPAAVARYLDAKQLPHAMAVWPQLAALDWAGAGLQAAARAANGADLVGLTGAFCAAAETGTLVLCSSPDSPATVSLLPETHIAVVAASRIVAGMEEAWALMRQELGELPRAVNFISGPSRTGDIEQTLVLGAHGPYRVHILVVAGA
ncbi:MAG: lactate utilization protein C [Rhodocyclales bacterium]|nr:lactate utilization protein C [Rhodocyclales bacterium]